MFVIKTHKLVKKKSHKNVNLCDKKSQTSVKNSQKQNFTNKQKKSQKCKFMS